MVRIAGVALSALTLMATCRAPTPATTASPEPAPEATPSAEVAERRFDPDVVRPAPDGAIARVRAALAADRAEEAAAIATQALSSGGEDDASRLFWLSARAHRESGSPVRAFALLENVATAEHPLASWARLERAKMLSGVDAARAVDEVAPLTELEWAGRQEARDVYAAALVAAGRGDEAEPLLRALLEEAPADGARAAVAMPLASLLALKVDEDAKVEAIGLFRRVAMRAPSTAAAREAEERIAAVLRELPEVRRESVREPTPEQALERAEALARSMQHAEAEEAFHAVAERTEDEALRCAARLGEGRAIYYRRERRRAAEHLSEVARDCDREEVRAWARYLAGKGFFSAGEPDLARAQYARLEDEVPAHSLADDARYRAALIDAETGDEASMVRRLTTLPETYPAGDMRGRARFMLAWRARRAGQLEQALTHLEASLAEGPMEDREDLVGRASYWRAVVLHELGRTDEAREALIAVVREAPLRYYAQQALVRLAELDPDDARRARATLGTEPGDPRITFAWREELDTPAFARALELLRVGEIDAARAELAWVRAQSERDDEELRWIEAALLDRAGAHAEAVYVTRRTLHDFMAAAPTGEAYARWRIAYPRAYAEAIEEAARPRPIPPELLFAIAREESSFRPDAVSVAHAYGLVQIILPTARRFGARVGIRPTARTLGQPAVNLQIGAEFMSWLWERYEDNPVILPSAYNAGQGATDRWLRERPDQRLDVWIEEIPYDETRRYTRRVIQSWGIYAWLDRRELPPLRAALPPG